MAKTVKKANTTAKTVETVKTPAPVVETKPVETPKAESVKEEKAPKAEKPAKKTTKTTKTAPAVKVFVEYQGRQMELDSILEAVKAASGKKTFKTLEVYVKPEDSAAYFVVNGKDTGKADI